MRATAVLTLLMLAFAAVATPSTAAHLSVRAEGEDADELDLFAEIEAEAEEQVEAEVVEADEDEADVESDAEDEAEAEDDLEADAEADAEAEAVAEIESESAMGVEPDYAIHAAVGIHAHNTPLHPQAPFAEAALKVSMAPAHAWYGHGGYMGFGGLLVSSQKWMNIMKALMPDVATAIIQKPDVKAVIKGLENNPVCAAMGYEYMKTTDHPQHLQPFEWDSFFAPTATVADPQVEATLVAHGKPLELFTEGTWAKNAYGAVERNPTTELGGVTAAKWRDLFVSALRLSANPSYNPNTVVTWDDFKAQFANGFHVILDVKTGIHQATAAFLSSVVAQWKARGVIVVGVGSFNYQQINGINAATKQAADVWFFHGLVDAGVPLVHQPQLFDIFASSPAMLAGKTVLFNAGFLIRYFRTGISLTGPNTKTASYEIDTAALAQLRKVAASVPTMTLGVYVQEYDIDTSALALINGVINSEPATFKAGFAWGGKPYSYYSSIVSTATDGTVGTNGQILFAKVNYK